ncbi:MAG: PilZ domain-containing protein [Bdellovibrionaceae bacterium]|nr:PilZ domain-containing protein [Pseudobdellovibrionaceae bacterium]
MGNQDDAAIYDLVTDVQRKKELVSSLVALSSSLRLEGDGFRASVNVIGQEPGGDLKVVWAGNPPPNLDENARVSVWFELRGQVYFFKCQPFYVPGGAVLGWAHEDFLRLQPRQDFRLAIPADYEASVEITSRAQGRVPLVARLIDVHTFGLGLLVPIGEKFSADENVEGVLTLGRHRPVKFASKVRFVRESGEGPQVGLAFDHGVHQTEDLLQQLLLNLRQDVFNLRRP